MPQLAGILKRNLASANVGRHAPFTKVLRMDVTSRAACGRVRMLRIATDRGEILVKGDKVRWALRPAGAEERILPSAWFDMKVAEGKALAEGRAFGHGIGLCQVGTIARAKAGQDFRTIMRRITPGPRWRSSGKAPLGRNQAGNRSSAQPPPRNFTISTRRRP